MVLGPCLPSNEDVSSKSKETGFEIIDSNIKEHENTYESDEDIFDYVSENNISNDSDID